MCPIYLQNNSESQQVPDYGNNIPGWMTIEELTWLYWVAQEMDSIVEIGSWKGRSTDALLAGCKGTVWAVDHFKGSKTEVEMEREAAKEDICKIFLGNVGHHKNLKLLKMDSLEAAKKFEDKSIDMVFIDGGHEYKEAKIDIETWLPKVKKLLCGHDCYNKGVKCAVKELFGNVSTLDLIWKKPIKEVS